MSRKRFDILAGLVLGLLFATSVFSGENPANIKGRVGEGDPVAGKEKSAMCQGCHGEDGNSASSEYPKLAGQYAVYINKQIKNFKTGARKDPVMSGMAAAVDDQDMDDIAAYFASQPQMYGSTAINKAGEARFKDSGNGCATCHGKNGKGMAGYQGPVIGGQHKEYLVKQLANFRNHKRTNDPGGVMGMIAGFMSEKDIEDVASYLSGL